MKIKNKILVGIMIFTLIGASLSITGCTDNDESNKKLTQTGSSTVLPLAIVWAEEFDEADISVSGGGSSHGLNSLLNGEADLGDASRLMKGKDYAKVKGKASLVKEDGTATGAAPTGVWPHKWVVAFDVLAVVVNNDNDWSKNLNYTQLYKIFTDDSSAVHWDEVPGLTNAPHEKIEIYAPDEASGTYDYFFEEIIPDWGDDTQQANTRLDAGDGVYHPSADDNVILNAIKDNKYAIGYFGFAYYKENPDKVSTVAIADGDDNYQEASLTNVANYPMARPLHIYTDGVPEEGDVINKYLRYVLGDEGQKIVPDVGYVQLALVDEKLKTDQLAKL